MASLAGLRRVSLRRRLSGGAVPGGGVSGGAVPGGAGSSADVAPEGGPQFGDVVGDVIAESVTSITVRPEDGPAVVIPRDHVVALREVPPQPVRPASSPDKVARLIASHWPGLESERLGGWLLRAGGGFTKRANSALVTGDPGMPMVDALSFVQQWYTQRGLPAHLVVLRAQSDLDLASDAVTSDTGVNTQWQVVEEVDILVGDLRGTTAPTMPAGVEVADSPSPAWLDLWRGGAAHENPCAVDVLTAFPARYLTLVDEADGTRAIGCTRLVVDRGWAHVACLEVVPSHRRRGLGRLLMDAAIAEAVARPGPTPTKFVVVEVSATNDAAHQLYAGLGMRAHHRARYLRADSPGQATSPIEPGHG